MAQHSVRISQLPEVEISHKDIIITIEADGGALGRMTISQGGLGWYPRGPSDERHFTWEQFERCVREWKG